jgi:hypothetical protein
MVALLWEESEAVDFNFGEIDGFGVLCVAEILRVVG